MFQHPILKPPSEKSCGLPVQSLSAHFPSCPAGRPKVKGLEKGSASLSSASTSTELVSPFSHRTRPFVGTTGALSLSSSIRIRTVPVAVFEPLRYKEKTNGFQRKWKPKGKVISSFETSQTIEQDSTCVSAALQLLQSESAFKHILIYRIVWRSHQREKSTAQNKQRNCSHQRVKSTYVALVAHFMFTRWPGNPRHQKCAV